MKEADIRNPATFARYLELVQEDVNRLFGDQAHFESVGCPACGGQNHEPEFTKVGFRYVTCKDCGTLFANPRPAPEKLKEFYVNSRSSIYWVEEFFLPMVEARREKIFRPRAAYVAERLPTLKEEKVGDIGAGFGLFLEELRSFWPQAAMVAIEPSAQMANICRSKGFEVIQTTIEELPGQEGGFGLVSAFELLEHLHEPRLLLEKACQLLRPGGYFLATTLNGEGFDIQVLWEKSKSVFPPHHLNFFNPRSLAGLCAAAGLTVEEITTPGQLDWNIVENALNLDGVGTDRFWQVVARTGSETCKQELQSWLSRHGFSSHMRIIARRN
ncbi:MAG: class I SAM-dependent methyltransferase [Thermodesulfobacteriota bacterium]